MGTGKQTEVVLVHGLWFGPWTLRPLEKALQDRGFATRQFKYSSTADSLEKHASELHRFALDTDADERHFLGHSLGGLVILRMLSMVDPAAAGRVLLLGTPLHGSVTARKLRQVPGSEHLLGQVKDVLEKGYAVLPPHRETGMIAGSQGIGLGLLTGGVGGPGDGTVALGETEMEGLKHRIVLPVTHTGMLLSPAVARQAAHFLEHGTFYPLDV